MGFVIAAEVHLQFHPVKAAPGDEVHHAGHRVGPVEGRCAVLHHFDALQGNVRHQPLHVDIAAAAVVVGGVDGALAVDQHQGGAAAQVAQVDAGIAGGAVIPRPVGGGDAQGAGVEAQGADDLLDVSGAHGVDAVPLKDRQGGGEIPRLPLQVAAGDDDFLDGFAAFRRRRLPRRDAGHDDARLRRRTRRQARKGIGSSKCSWQHPKLNLRRRWRR